MSQHAPLPQQVARIDHQVDALIERLQRLQLENRSLVQQRESLLEERAKLIEKNELARVRVDAMILRLKALETHS